MHRRPLHRRSVSFLAVLASLTLFAPSSVAQNVEKVRIKTVDGVELSGQFYAGKGETPAVVMLLHGLKENSKSKEWTALAKKLQQYGFAVLSFDFRGFGSGTTEIDQNLFWAPQNTLNRLIPGPKESISSKDFLTRAPQYLPALVNDIAAAKAFLDRRNDGNAGGARCNSSNLILVGSKEGATLGAIWLNAEWHRYKVKADQLGQPLIQVNAFGAQGVADASQPAAGTGVIGAVWLSITPKLGISHVPLDFILGTAGKKQCTPMVFVFGEDDAASKRTGRSLESKLVTYKKLKDAKGQRVPDDKYKLTRAVGILNTKLEGSALLQEGLGTVDQLAEYIDAVAQAKSNEWIEQDFRKTAYVWVSGPVLNGVVTNGQLIKRPTELHLNYSDYSKFR